LLYINKAFKLVKNQKSLTANDFRLNILLMTLGFKTSDPIALKKNVKMQKYRLRYK